MRIRAGIHCATWGFWAPQRTCVVCRAEATAVSAPLSSEYTHISIPPTSEILHLESLETTSRNGRKKKIDRPITAIYCKRRNHVRTNPAGDQEGDYIPACTRHSRKYSLSGKNVALVTLNQPKKLNALSAELYYELAQVLRKIANMPQISVTVLTGTGKYFSA